MNRKRSKAKVEHTMPVKHLRRSQNSDPISF